MPLALALTITCTTACTRWSMHGKYCESRLYMSGLHFSVRSCKALTHSTYHLFIRSDTVASAKSGAPHQIGITAQHSTTQRNTTHTSAGTPTTIMVSKQAEGSRTHLHCSEARKLHCRGALHGGYGILHMAPLVLEDHVLLCTTTITTHARPPAGAFVGPTYRCSPRVRPRRAAARCTRGRGGRSASRSACSERSPPP